MTEPNHANNGVRITNLAIYARLGAVESKVDRLVVLMDEKVGPVQVDHEKRLRRLERVAWAALGTGGISLISLILKAWHPSLPLP